MLPNGFYKNLENVAEIDLEFVCYGIPRSGSTLVYQLISGIYPEGVAKTHRYCPHRVKTAVSFRDFRDVVVSLWRRSNPTKVDRQMNQGDIEKFAGICQDRVKDLNRYFDRGEIGGWRQFVGDRDAERLETLLQEPLRRYGYV